MSKVTMPDLPIGYWLKETDNLLTKHVNRVHKANGITRFEWQVLNMLSQTGGSDRDSIFGIMRTFIEDAELDKILNRFMGLGWIEQFSVADSPEANFRLTENGRAQHKLILATQKEARKKIMQGIDETDYATTLRVLQQMVDNLRQS